MSDEKQIKDDNTPPEQETVKNYDEPTAEEINDNKEWERLNLEIKLRQIKRQEKYKKSKSKKALKIFMTLLLITAVISGGFVGYFLLKANPVKSAEHILEYMETKFSGSVIYMDGEKTICPTAPVYEKESVYIPLSFVFTNFGHNILYDKTNKIVNIALGVEMTKLLNNENSYYVNGIKKESDKITFIEENSEAYISKEILEEVYPITISFSKENKTLMLDDIRKERSTAITSEEQKLYDKNGKSLDITISKGEYITIYDEIDNRAKIITSNGICGYIDINGIENKTRLKPINDIPVKTQTLVVSGKPVVLFDQITTMAANNSSAKNNIPDAVDVLVPTWFSFATDENGKTDGKIISLADKTYVDSAHSKGRKVWGLITDNFNSSVSRSVVVSSKTREYVINQITSYVKQYNLDGINVDFENIPSDSMREFTQFLRELSVALNNIDVCLSIDVYTPEPWSLYYNRDEFGEIVDYFIVMGYDEHTSSSEETGSVATKKWSEESITLTMKVGVPAEKLLLGIPFYTRMWKENPDGSFETDAYGMERGYKAMTDIGGHFTWLEEIGQNYAETEYNGFVYKMWLEDEKSVEERLKLINKHNIAGVAAWKRNLEKPVVWSVIKKYMKG